MINYIQWELNKIKVKKDKESLVCIVNLNYELNFILF